MPSSMYRLMEKAMWLANARKGNALTGSALERSLDAALAAGPPAPWEPDALFERRWRCACDRVEIAGCACFRLRCAKREPGSPRPAAPSHGGCGFAAPDSAGAAHAAGAPCGAGAPHAAGAPRSAGAVLYLNGGGFAHPPKRRDFDLAAKIAAGTGREVWLFCYPLEPHACIRDITARTLDAYRAMLSEYRPRDVVFFGLSSGACLCLYVLNRIAHEHTGDPYPARLVLNSPVVELPPTEAQLARMSELDRFDCVLPASYFGDDGTIGWMLRHEPADCLYLSRVLEADMAGWPPVTAVFGTHETPFAYEADFASALDAHGVPFEIVEVPGCGHCTVLYSPTPEAKQLLRWELAAMA